MFIRLRYASGSVFVDEGNINKIREYVENFEAKPIMVSDTEIRKYTEAEVRDIIGNKRVKNELNGLFGIKDKTINTFNNTNNMVNKNNKR